MPKPLILTFLGGGSRRILGLLRGALGRGLLQDGGIRLFDPREERAAAVAAVLRRTPEFAASPCRVSTHGRSQEALEGADLVYAVFPCGSRLRLHQSMLACRLRGHIGSDQLSPSGAIMALKGGPIILDYARQMERCCWRNPDARRRSGSSIAWPKTAGTV